jgi:RNA polymerase sigma-70 factor (ECF subfamily)
VDDPAGSHRDDRDVFVGVYKDLLRFARAVRPMSVDPEDLVQEALARTLSTRRLTSLDRPDVYLRRAVLTVAMNEQRRLRRQRSRWGRIGADPDVAVDAYPSDVADLMRLTPKARAVVYLHFVEEMPYDEVADALGCSTEAARKTASRALDALRSPHDAASLEAR